jgi:hypothetical protein
MWPFSKLGGDGELVALFDVGSSSVGGALFRIHRSSPTLVFSVREPIPIQKEFRTDRFFTSTMKTLDEVAEKLAKSGHGSPRRFFSVISSPWYGSQTRVVKFGSETSFVFNSQAADELIQKETEVFRAEHAKDYDQDSRVLPIELKNMKTMLNGYVSANPIGQKAKDVEMTLYISMSSENFLKQVQDMVVRHFHREEVKFSSFAFVAFAVARDAYPDKKNFLLVDIGGELTDISLIKDDVLATSISFPKGINFLVRQIAEGLDCSAEDARSLLSLYNSGHASQATEKKLESFIEGLKRDWLEGFQQSLASLSHEISLPSMVFITVERGFTDFFREVIQMEQYSQYTLTESKFDIVFLGAAELHGETAVKEGVIADPLILLESIYINRFLR